jgi:hypothetical protein
MFVSSPPLTNVAAPCLVLTFFFLLSPNEAMQIRVYVWPSIKKVIFQKQGMLGNILYDYSPPLTILLLFHHRHYFQHRPPLQLVFFMSANSLYFSPCLQVTHLRPLRVS